MRHIVRGLAATGLLAFAVAGCSDSDAGGPERADDAPGPTAEAFCAEIEALNQRFEDDPAAANDVDAVVDAMEGLAAPDEIADDLQIVVDGARAQADVDPNDADAVSELQDQLAAVGEAQQRLNDYITENCEIEGDAAG